MGEMDKIDLKGAMYMLIILLGGYGAYKVISFVYLLIIGATAQVAISGDIAVPEIINNTTGDVLTSVETGFQGFISADAVIIGLIALVVIIKVFWPLISRYLPKGNKGLN